MRTFPNTSRPVLLGTAAIAATLLLSGCGGSSSSPTGSGSSSSKPSVSASYGPAASGPHNDADVTFATDMIPHHAQAVEMADLALEHATNAEVTTLAKAIKGAQDPEILTMSGWLVGWGKDVPKTAGHGSDMGGHSAMGGMMSDAQMQELSDARGAAFDKLWVQMMSEHHTGAIEMAKTELADGSNAEAKSLAEDIIAAQTAELATMTKLASSLPS